MNEVRIQAGRATLDGNLTIVDGATALVLFAHGSGSGRHSPRNQFVARTLNKAGLATLLFDLLTPDEELIDVRTADAGFANRIFRIEYGRSRGARGSGGNPARRRRRRFARRTT